MGDIRMVIAAMAIQNPKINGGPNIISHSGTVNSIHITIDVHNNLTY
jgi:hypothetical protein